MESIINRARVLTFSAQVLEQGGSSLAEKLSWAMEGSLVDAEHASARAPSSPAGIASPPGEVSSFPQTYLLWVTASVETMGSVLTQPAVGSCVQCLMCLACRC